jgi:flavin-dependent dehydrogenase
MRLHFGTRVIRHPLPEPAYGLSRYELDRLLLEHAASAGAQVVRERWSTAAQGVAVIRGDGRPSRDLLAADPSLTHYGEITHSIQPCVYHPGTA